jgi:hypothetical protein
MQTFVPERTFHDIGLILDRQRLGKQRVETLQILRANLGLTKGWVNHPASKMWRGHEAGLCAYGIAMCDAWTAKGYTDSCADKMRELVRPDANDLPEWWGRADIMESHRSNLVRKFPEHYRNFYPAVLDNLPYVWVG